MKTGGLGDTIQATLSLNNIGAEMKTLIKDEIEIANMPKGVKAALISGLVVKINSNEVIVTWDDEMVTRESIYVKSRLIPNYSKNAYLPSIYNYGVKEYSSKFYSPQGVAMSSGHIVYHATLGKGAFRHEKTLFVENAVTIMKLRYPEFSIKITNSWGDI